MECGQLCPDDELWFCWFIDGNHEYENVYKETTEAIKSDSKYIIYHDADLDKIEKGIMDSFKDNNKLKKYDIYKE